ncbi:MAG: hypothetical protein PHW50_00050 [Patescibacteria group bacterium]|nr:hypothetical protein [Patescibacteria group bacterium]
MANLEFDNERAIEIFKYAVWAWENKILGYGKMKQPEVVYMPDFIKYGSVDHRRWIFFGAAINRYGQASNRAMPKFSKSIVLDPRLIDPMSDFENLDYHQLLSGVMGFVSINSELGREGKLRIDGWRHNLKILRDQYDGDPGEIILRAERSREGVISALSNFYGIASKVAQLAAIWYQDVAWQYCEKDWKEIREIEMMPVDLWILRFMRQWDIVINWDTDQHDAVRLPTSEFIAKICHDYNINHSRLSNAFWHAGQICVKRPMDPYSVGSYCYVECPFNRYCKRICTGSMYKVDGTMNWNYAFPRLTLFSSNPS